MDGLPDVECIRPLWYTRVVGEFVVIIGLIITGLIEADGLLTAVGVVGGTDEIVARRFVGVVADWFGAFGGGSAAVDCSK